MDAALVLFSLSNFLPEINSPGKVGEFSFGSILVSVLNAIKLKIVCGYNVKLLPDFIVFCFFFLNFITINPCNKSWRHDLLKLNFHETNDRKAKQYD